MIIGKKSAVLLTIVACLMLLQLSTIAYAKTTQIEVSSLPDEYITIRILQPGEKYSSLQTFTGIKTDSSGKATVSHSSDFSKIDVELYLKFEKNGATQFFDKYLAQETGGTLSLELPKKKEAQMEEASVALNNSTVIVQPEVVSQEGQEPASVEGTSEDGSEEQQNQESEQETGAPITGQAVTEGANSPSLSPLFYYIVAGFLMAGLFILGTYFFKKKFGKGGLPEPPADPEKIQSISKAKVFKIGRSSGGYDDLKAAEQKLRVAQEEINRIKRIRDLELSIKREQDELGRLRR